MLLPPFPLFILSLSDELIKSQYVAAEQYIREQKICNIFRKKLMLVLDLFSLHRP